MNQEVAGLQQRVFPTWLSFRNDFDGSALLVQPAGHGHVFLHRVGYVTPSVELEVIYESGENEESVTAC